MSEKITSLDMMEKLLMLSYGVDLPVTSLETEKPRLGGNNFSSTCNYVTVYFGDKKQTQLELFVKELTENPSLANVVKELQYFEKEAAFFNVLYQDVAAFCERKERYDGFLQRVIPKCYYADKELIVLDNLVKRDFALLREAAPHSYKQARVAMESLAQLHAASYGFIEEVGLEHCKERYPLFTRANLWCEANWKSLKGPFVRAGIDGAAKILELCPTRGSSKALALIRKYQTVGFSLSSHFELNDNCYATVLCHGDCWNGNMMWQLKPNSLDPHQCSLIDFQTMHFGTPAVDLVTYLFIAVDSETRRKHWKTLLHHYFIQFKRFANMLEYDLKFSLKDLLKDFRDNREVGFILSFFPIIVSAAAAEMEDVDAVGGNIAEYFESKFAASLDKIFQDRGWALSQEIIQSFTEYESLSAIVTK